MLQSKKFQKKTENFICENCGHKNIGDGFTNHCSQCLYSKHVDINPGDRKCKCDSLMKPVAIINKNKKIYIKHECLKCGFEKLNQVAKNDNFDEIIKLSIKLD